MKVWVIFLANVVLKEFITNLFSERVINYHSPGIVTHYHSPGIVTHYHSPGRVTHYHSPGRGRLLLLLPLEMPPFSLMNLNVANITSNTI